MGRTVIFCLNFNDTFLEVYHDEERSDYVPDCVLPKPQGHSDRMYGLDQRVQRVISRIDWKSLLKKLHITSTNT